MIARRLAGLLLLGALPWAPAWADRQMDPELRGVIAAVIEPTKCFDDKYERAVWFATMEPRLQRYVADAKEREQILHNVHCESRRVGIPPELVLAVMDVESRFDRFAVSSAGAVGLMQVMPMHEGNWPPCEPNLENVEANICHGARIFAHYFRAENGHIERALLRYNGCVRGTNTPDCHRYPYHVYARAGRASGVGAD